MKQALMVGVGGFVGAIARYLVALLVARVWAHRFPLGTFVINVSGAFVLGYFATWTASRSIPDHPLRLLVATGFLGAYTTFSTLEYETFRLTASGATGWAFTNVVGSAVAGFAAVWLGVRLAQ